LTEIPPKILVDGAIRPGCLAEGTRKELVALGRDGKAENGVTRRANARLLLDGRRSRKRVAQALDGRRHSFIGMNLLA
jgi:hypothetical protein